MRHEGCAPQSSLIIFKAAISSDTRQCTDSFSEGDEIFVGRDGFDARFGRAPAHEAGMSVSSVGGHRCED
jgi:hypothetical protein